MRIVDKYEGCHRPNKPKRTIYTVELEKDVGVEVMVTNNGRLIYVMQNEDGSTVKRFSSGQMLPGYVYDEPAVVALVKANIN